jgi:hypothetical protein
VLLTLAGGSWTAAEVKLPADAAAARGYVDDKRFDQMAGELKA